MSQLKLTRVGCEVRIPGWWMSSDKRFSLVHRKMHQTPHWAIRALHPSTQAWLKQRQLLHARFPTRKAALARLEDALQLETEASSIISDNGADTLSGGSGPSGG